MEKDFRLIVDLGNSRMKAAVFSGDDIVKSETCANKDREAALQKLISGFAQQIPCIVSSVVEALPAGLPEDFLLLSHNTSIPLINKYLSPEKLGKDRLANACFLSSAAKGKNALVIDAGTCLKFDFVNNNNEYLGGSIAPGLGMRFKAMHTFTDRLPLLETQPASGFLGQNTEESMTSGAYTGMKCEIEGMTELYRREYGSLSIYLTGGDAGLFANALNFPIFADPFLTLRGLNTILKHNA